MKIVSVDQMIAIEKAANQSGIPYERMMDSAGTGVADWVLHTLDCRAGVVGLVGSGNNGGDTLISLTRLAQKGIRTFAYLVRPRVDDPLLSRYVVFGGAVVDLTSIQNMANLEAALVPGAILLDGMLGTGFHLPLQGELLEVMRGVQRVVDKCPGIRVIAVDCPSGVDCDTGEASELCLKASDTLTMAAVKQGLLMPPARVLVGDIHGVDIGIGEIDTYLDAPVPTTISSELACESLPDRPESGHKGTFGTALIVAGSRSYTGAAFLAGKAAYLAGCGLVHMAVVPAVQQSLAGRLVEAIWTSLPEEEGVFSPEGVEILTESLPKADVLAMGPGWGLQPSNKDFLAAALAKLGPHKPEFPCVVDADGLKLLVDIMDWWQKLPKQTILTPHPGEMSILTGLTIEEIQTKRWEITRQYAVKWKVTLVLKGACTVIGTPEGNLFINLISDSALGTAGSGDVLTGVIAGLLAQGLSTNDAAILGVWLHGRAGQLAHARLEGPESVTALGILEAIPQAIVATKKAGR